MPALVERSGIPPARIIVRVHYTSREELLSDLLSDGGPGLVLRSELDLVLGGRVTLELTGAFLDQTLFVDGVVRFKRGTEPEAEGSGQAEVGIELLTGDPEQQRAVDRFVSLVHESRADLQASE